jgi:hypothetical protein
MNGSLENHADMGDFDSTDDGSGYTVGVFISLVMTIAIAILAGPSWHYLIAGLLGVSFLVSIVVGWVRIRHGDSRS